MTTDNADDASGLFPGPDARRAMEDHLTERLGSAIAALPDRPVSPNRDEAAFRRALAAFDFEAPTPLEDAIDWVIDQLADGAVQMTHPGYFGLFNPAPTLAAESADRIASAFNPQICVWSHAPSAVEIENHTITAVARRAGLGPSAGGHFTSGGSEANLTALVCALTAASPEFANQGVRGFDGVPTLYVSAESHLAWLKIAHATGLGRNAVRLVDTDGTGRMDMDALRSCIAADRECGDVPVMVCATAGTTNAGMIDPLRECALLCRDQGLWYHVDAAWGGALIASAASRSVLGGIERADSITIDAHKWFATTMGAGMFLTARPEYLDTAFDVVTGYMPDSDGVSDYYVSSMQWSRRFVGLRLFLALAAAGWAGYARHVERGVALIDRLVARMTAAGWRHCNDSPMAVACLQPPNGPHDVDRCVSAVVATGRHWVSVTRLEGEPVVRACVTNGRTDVTDIDALADALLLAGGPELSG